MLNYLCQDLECEDWILVCKIGFKITFTLNYLQLLNKNVPLMRPSKKKSENGQRVPWITKGILYKIQGKQKMC